jgi:type III pantothenate kinase|tara:strand:- start:110 stop:856 length:747 start_codon:yes stop_codon:yes gene_type:complete
MILLGDIGNTESKICLVNSKNKIIKKFNFTTKNINYLLLKKISLKLNLKKNKVKKSLFCSVVPKSFKLIKFFFYKHYKLNCYELKDLKINKLIKIKVNNNQIGSDRLANAISVMNNKNNFIILDFGTATTFDVVIKNVYHGGVIAPGLRLSLNTLIDKASLIPNLDLKKINKVIGLNTVNAVRSGFFWGYRGLINNIISLIKKETKKSFKIIITGGFSYLFRNSINMKVTINKDITIKGLIKASNLIK